MDKKKGEVEQTTSPLEYVISSFPPYFARISPTGTGSTCASGLEEQDAHRQRPAAAAIRMVIFMLLSKGLHMSNMSAVKPRSNYSSLQTSANYLAAGMMTGAGAGSSCWEQEALTMTPQAAAAIAMILTVFILAIFSFWIGL